MNRPETYRSEVNIIPPEKKAEIHEWIVKTSVDKNVIKSLNRLACPKCDNPVFEANTVCKSCMYKFDTCIVTGYPIHPKVDCVSCSSCGKKAIKECWKEWISAFEQCPWCRSVQMSYK